MARNRTSHLIEKILLEQRKLKALAIKDSLAAPIVFCALFAASTWGVATSPAMADSSTNAHYSTTIQSPVKQSTKQAGTPKISTTAATSKSSSPIAHSNASSTKSTTAVTPTHNSTSTTHSTVSTKSPSTSKAPATTTPVHHYHYVPRKLYTLKSFAKPAPTQWPPKGFANLQADSNTPDSYGKYATLADIKNESTLSEKVKDTLVYSCTKYACRGVYLTAINSCSFWEIDSDVYGVDPNNTTQLAKLGSLVTYSAATKGKQVGFTLLVSKEVANPGTTITNVSATCMSGSPVASIGTNIYSPNTGVTSTAAQSSGTSNSDK